MERSELEQFLGALASMRGFFLEHDAVPEVAGAEGEEVPVLSSDGDRVGVRLVLAAAPSEVAEPLDREERTELLTQLAGAEAQAVGWSLLQPAVVESVKASEDYEGEAEAFVGRQDRWRALLLRPCDEGRLAQTSARLSAELAAAKIDRRSRSGLLRDLPAEAILGDSEVVDATRFWTERARSLRSELLEGNIGLVMHWAAKEGRAIGLDNAFLAGLAGLDRALDTFEVETALQLSTYATYWVRQSIQRQSQNHRRPLRMPVHRHDMLAQWVLAVRRAWRPGAPIEEAFRGAAKELGLDDRRALLRADLAEPTISADRRMPGSPEPIGECLVDVGLEPAYLLPRPDSLAEALGFLDSLQDWLGDDRRSQNPSRDRTVLLSRLGVGLAREITLEQIGGQYGVTRERIRQIEAKVLKELRARYRLPMEQLWLQLLPRDR